MSNPEDTPEFSVPVDDLPDEFKETVEAASPLQPEPAETSGATGSDPAPDSSETTDEPGELTTDAETQAEIAAIDDERIKKMVEEQFARTRAGETTQIAPAPESAVEPTAPEPKVESAEVQFHRHILDTVGKPPSALSEEELENAKVAFFRGSGQSDDAIDARVNKIVDERMKGVEQHVASQQDIAAEAKVRAILVARYGEDAVSDASWKKLGAAGLEFFGSAEATMEAAYTRPEKVIPVLAQMAGFKSKATKAASLATAPSGALPPGGSAAAGDAEIVNHDFPGDSWEAFCAERQLDPAATNIDFSSWNAMASQ